LRTLADGSSAGQRSRCEPDASPERTSH